MNKKKLKRGSFVLVSCEEYFIKDRLCIVTGFDETKVIVYVIDIDITIKVDIDCIKEV